MIARKPKPKKCAYCRCEFLPVVALQKFCCLGCTVAAKKKAKKAAKPKAPKKQSLPALIRKADTVTSQYIRYKYADGNGYVKCVTCGQVLHWKDAHCAHYVERAAKGTRWLEENLHPACPSCNVFRKEFHKREYTLFIIDTYGRDKIDEFKRMAKQVLSAGQVRQLAEEAIEYYSTERKELTA